MISINILLVGEAGTGKTALIKKFNDPNYTFTPIGEADYWSYQAAPETLTKEIVINGQKVTLNINEVAGSRGRMGNHYEIMTAVKMGTFSLQKYIFFQYFFFQFVLFFFFFFKISKFLFFLSLNS